MRRVALWIAIALAAALFLVGVGGAIVTAASANVAHCSERYNMGCAWSRSGFTGDRELFPPVTQNWFKLGGWRSAKNAYDNRRMVLKTKNNGDVCLNPGRAAGHPGFFNTLRIGRAGSRCRWDLKRKEKQ